MIAVMRIKGICIRCDMLRVMPDGEYICSDCMGFSRKDYRGKVRPFFSDGGRFGKFEGRQDGARQPAADVREVQRYQGQQRVGRVEEWACLR